MNHDKKTVTIYQGHINVGLGTLPAHTGDLINFLSVRYYSVPVRYRHLLQCDFTAEKINGDWEPMVHISYQRQMTEHELLERDSALKMDWIRRYNEAAEALGLPLYEYS